jgi:hypothetical protein
MYVGTQSIRNRLELFRTAQIVRCEDAKPLVLSGPSLHVLTVEEDWSVPSFKLLYLALSCKFRCWTRLENLGLEHAQRRCAFRRANSSHL